MILDVSNRRRRRDCRRSFRWQDSHQPRQSRDSQANEQQAANRNRARNAATNQQTENNSTGMRLRSGQIKPVQIRQIKR